MPLFSNAANIPVPIPQSTQRQIRILEPSLAENTDTQQPTLVGLPSQTRQRDRASSIVGDLADLLDQPQGALVSSAVPSVIRDTGTINDFLAAQVASTTGPTLNTARGTTGDPRIGDNNVTNIADRGTGAPQDIVAFSESIAQIESSNNYDAVGVPTRFGTAKGKYQFVDATWRRAAAAAGYGQFATALDAPDQIQDAVAHHWFASLLRRYDGNYTAVAIAHHAGEGNADRFIQTGTIGTADVLGTQTADYARRAVQGAFG